VQSEMINNANLQIFHLFTTIVLMMLRLLYCYCKLECKHQSHHEKVDNNEFFCKHEDINRRFSNDRPYK